LLDDGEFKRFIAALLDPDFPVGSLALRLLLLTGMRKSEVLKLPWSSVDLANRTIRLEKAMTKNGRERIVVLNGAAVAVLVELRGHRVGNHPYVCPGGIPGSVGHLRDLRRPFQSALKKAGISDFKVHDLRHQYCSVLASSGVPLLTIARLVGHRSLKTTERYCHSQLQDLYDATDVMAVKINAA
jgi:integrase